jgi:hypothetical protein
MDSRIRWVPKRWGTAGPKDEGGFSDLVALACLIHSTRQSFKKGLAEFVVAAGERGEVSLYNLEDERFDGHPKPA